MTDAAWWKASGRNGTCHYRRGMLHCDMPKGHEGWHTDNWILSSPTRFSDTGRPESAPGASDRRTEPEKGISA